MSLLLLTNKTKKKNKQTSKQNDYMAPFYGAAVYRHGKNAQWRGSLEK